MLKWELDLWYELWDRAGSQGLDTWHDPRGAGGGEQTPVVPDAPDPIGATGGEPEGT